MPIERELEMRRWMKGEDRETGRVEDILRSGERIGEVLEREMAENSPVALAAIVGILVAFWLRW